MALNTLTLSVNAGVQGRGFVSAIGGITIGNNVDVEVDGTPGFSVTNGYLRNSSLLYPVNTVALIERNPTTGEFKRTRIEISAATPAYPTIISDGSAQWTVPGGTGGASLTAGASSYLSSVSAGALIANLSDPFAGLGLGTTAYATFGSVPGQLALSGSTIVAGASASVAGTTYSIGVRATSGDGKRSVGETLAFGATSGTVTLGALTLNGTLTQNTAASGVTISGALTDETITLGGANAGLTVQGPGSTTRTVTGTPTSSGAITATQTSPTASNSPRGPNALGTVAAAAVTLGTLTLSGTITNGTASSGTIIGATAGSTITSNVPGLTVNSGARTYSWDGTGPAATTANGLVETLAGATNTPRSNSVTVAAASVTLGTLTVSPLSATAGSAYSGTISGKTSGSTITAVASDGTVLTVVGTAVSGTFSAAGSPTITLTETLAGATNTPHASPAQAVTVASAGGATAVRLATAPNYYGIGLTGALGATRRTVVRRPFYVGKDGASDLRASFTNTWTTKSGADTGNAFTVVSLYLEKGDGSQSVQMTFDGATATSKTVAFDVKDVQSDPILPAAFGLGTFAGNSQWWERVVFEVPLSTDKMPGSLPIQGGYTGFTAYKFDPATFPSFDASGTGPLDGTGKTAIASGNKTHAAIWLGTVASTTRTYLNRGDSFTRDNESDSGTTNVFLLRLFADLFERACVNEFGTVFEPFLNCGVYGSGIVGYSGTSDPCSPYYKYATDFHDELGTNDVGSGTGPLTTSITALWAKYASESPGCRIWRTLLVGAPSSTDNYLTEVNQTVSPSVSSGNIPTMNAYFETKRADGTLTGLIPWGRVRGVTDFYKFRVNGVQANYTIGANHPGFAGIPMMALEAGSIMRANAQAVPSLPVLTVTADDTSITVIYTSTGEAVTDTLFEISSDGGSTWTGQHSYDTAKCWSWRGLTASTAYQIRVTPINSKGSGTAATTSKSTTAQPTLLLDGVSTPATAVYSTRRLRGAYKGGAFWVMRLSDRAQIEIGFKPNGDLDTDYLLAWADGSSVRIRERLDQSGNGYTQKPAFTSFQYPFWPFLVNSGTMAALPNGKSAEELNASGYYRDYTLASNPTIRTVFAVVNPSNLSSPRCIIGGGGTGGYLLQLNTTDGRLQLAKQATPFATASSGSGISVGSVTAYTAAYDTSGPYEFRKNGTSINTGSSAQTFTAGLLSGFGNSSISTAGASMTGKMPEALIFDGALLSSTDRDAIEASQVSYYGAA